MFIICYLEGNKLFNIEIFPKGEVITVGYVALSQ